MYTIFSLLYKKQQNAIGISECHENIKLTKIIIFINIFSNILTFNVFPPRMNRFFFKYYVLGSNLILKYFMIKT